MRVCLGEYSSLSAIDISLLSRFHCIAVIVVFGSFNKVYSSSIFLDETTRIHVMFLYIAFPSHKYAYRKLDQMLQSTPALVWMV